MWECSMTPAPRSAIFLSSSGSEAGSIMARSPSQTSIEQPVYMCHSLNQVPGMMFRQPIRRGEVRLFGLGVKPLVAFLPHRKIEDLEDESQVVGVGLDSFGGRLAPPVPGLGFHPEQERIVADISGL